MIIDIGFKNGTEIAVKCESFSIEKNVLGVPLSYSFEGVTENMPLYIDISEVNYILRRLYDEVE